MPLTYDIARIEPPSSFDEGLLELIRRKLAFLDALDRDWQEQLLGVPEPTPEDIQRIQRCLESLDVSTLPPVPFFASGPLSKRWEDA